MTTPSRDDAGPATPADRLRTALRAGELFDLISTLEQLSPAERRTVARRLLPVARAILAAPGQSREPEHWDGPLRDEHWEGATVIRLVSASTASIAAKVQPLDARVARDVIPSLFPDELDAFVSAWSARYAARPKGWDANRGIGAMFDWAHRGLIPPPMQQGAVLALLSWAPAPTGPDLLAYLLERPVLIRSTLPQLFQVAGVRGASAAQFDQSLIDPDRRGLRSFVIPELIRNGHWRAEEVVRWCEDALQIPRTEYEYRWFRALRGDLV